MARRITWLAFVMNMTVKQSCLEKTHCAIFLPPVFQDSPHQFYALLGAWFCFCLESFRQSFVWSWILCFKNSPWVLHFQFLPYEFSPWVLQFQFLPYQFNLQEQCCELHSGSFVHIDIIIYFNLFRISSF